MRISRTTMLFEDIGDLHNEMFEYGRSIVMDGVIGHPVPWWVTQWIQECGLTETQWLMIMSTAFPQKLLLSLLLDK